MLLGGTISGVIATYIYNGGATCLYFGMYERGVPYLVVSTVLLFLLQDGAAYYLHRSCSWLSTTLAAAVG